MKLIIIMIALLFGRFFTDFIQYRRYGWFKNHVAWMENRLSAYGIWNSRAGVILVLALPCTAVLLISGLLCEITSLLSFIFAVMVLFLCLGHEPLTDQIEDYIEGIEADDEQKQAENLALIDASLSIKDSSLGDILSAVFNQSNQRIFAVLLWFIVLGPFGALLYRLTFELYKDRKDIHGEFSESVVVLYQVLNWPASRLTLISYALVGNLTHTFEVWTGLDNRGLDGSEAMLGRAGIAAIQYDESRDVSDVDWLDEAHGLINRSLLLWMTLIAFGTIAGWFS